MLLVAIHLRLAAVCERELILHVDKSEQTSDWSTGRAGLWKVSGMQPSMPRPSCG
jgi:hypothetical protein